MTAGERNEYQSKADRLAKRIRESGGRIRIFLDFNEESERSSAFVDGFREYSGTVDGLIEFLEEKSKTYKNW